MTLIKTIEEQINYLVDIKHAKKIKTGYMIGNTARIVEINQYVTPIRSFSKMIVGGVIINCEKSAMNISKLVDGKVDYVLVDAEKKVDNISSISGDPANIERIVREEIHQSQLLTYKGNDVSVEAIDAFVGYKYKDHLRGIGGKRITILGAGNFGTKLALKFVERGAKVIITRRNESKLKLIVNALNNIKPAYTTEYVKYDLNNKHAANNADILIATTNNYPVVTKDMIKNLNDDAIVIDAGKGTINQNAVEQADKMEIEIFRLDVTAALAGMIETQLMNEDIFKYGMGRRSFKNNEFVAGGLLGKKGDIVLDNITNPTSFLGIADGHGDFNRKITDSDEANYKELVEQLKKENIIKII